MENNIKIYLPKDFNDLKIKTIKSEIDKGNISISGMPYNFYEDDWTALLYLREKSSNGKVDIAPSSISANDVLAWFDYSDILAELVRFYENKDPYDIIIKQLNSKFNTTEEKIATLKILEKQLIWKKIIYCNQYYSPKEVKGMKYLYK